MSESAAEKLHNLTIDDLAADPHKYGLPTFEEFAKNPAKWRPREDEHMIVLTDGPEQFRKNLKKIRYFVFGKQFSSEESFYEEIRNCGYFGQVKIGSKDSKIRTEMIPVGGGWDHEIHVHFAP